MSEKLGVALSIPSNKSQYPFFIEISMAEWKSLLKLFE